VRTSGSQLEEVERNVWKRLYWALSGFVLFVFAAFGLSRRFHTLFEDAPVSANVLLVTLVVIGLVCAIACYFAVGPDQPRRPGR
jgi:hypothetical protein